MADFDSSLPVRTENPGDVISKIADATTPSQQLAVSAAGRASTSDGANGPVTPGTVASFSELAGGQFNTVLPTLTDTQQVALQVDSSGRLITTSSNFPSTLDTNYGTVGANTLRTASEIGNATGAANFNFGTVGAQTLRTGAQIGNATGAADFNAGTSGAQTLRTTSNITRNGTELDYNYGAVGANTLRSASQIGNATGAADFNAGATGAQTLRVEANQGAANATPWNVAFASPGTPVNDFKAATVIGAGATDNHDYTVTALKTLHFNQVESSGSGKAKMIVQIETGVATGVFTTRFTQFNSTAETNMSILLQNPISVAAGVRVRIAMSNRDLLSQDLYSTISGYEV